MFSHVGTIAEACSATGGAVPLSDARCRSSLTTTNVQRLYSNQRAAAAAHWQFPPRAGKRVWRALTDRPTTDASASPPRSFRADGYVVRISSIHETQHVFIKLGLKVPTSAMLRFLKKCRDLRSGDFGTFSITR